MGIARERDKHDGEHVTTYPHSILCYCRYSTDVWGALTTGENAKKKKLTWQVTVYVCKNKKLNPLQETPNAKVVVSC